MKKIVALVLSLVMVLGLATTAFGAVATYDLYKGDDTTVVTGEARTPVAAKALTTKQDGQVACWEINDNYYVEIKESEATKADYYLTKAGDDKAVMYLRAVENKGVYTLTGKAYSNFGDDDCGEWNMDPETTDMYVDAKGNLYFAGTQAYMLVDGVVVGVSPATDNDYDTYYIGHQMEGVYDKDDELVGVKCVVCGATGTVYATAAKAPMGATTFDFDTVVYVLDAAKAPAADSDKVESAETFDAGIAMYVGMSVMAAAGSAVVLKKKD